MRKIKKRGMIRLQQNLKSADKVNGENTAETIEENAGAKSGYVEETEKIVEDTVTVTPDEVIFDETEKEGRKNRRRVFCRGSLESRRGGESRGRSSGDGG